MRKYHIYIQISKVVKIHFGRDYATHKWISSLKYINSICGTKKLYKWVKYNNYYISDFCDSFDHKEEYFDKPIITYYRSNIPTCKRFIIIDDSGNIRNIRELISKYEKNLNRRIYPSHRKRAGYSYHYVNISDQKKSLTPEEVQEIKNKYGIFVKPIKPKRIVDPYGIEKLYKNCGWKMQTKKKRQWGKLNNEY